MWLNHIMKNVCGFCKLTFNVFLACLYPKFELNELQKQPINSTKSEVTDWHVWIKKQSFKLLWPRLPNEYFILRYSGEDTRVSTDFRTELAILSEYD